MGNATHHTVLKVLPDGGDGTLEEGSARGHPRRTQEKVLHYTIANTTAQADGLAH